MILARGLPKSDTVGNRHGMISGQFLLPIFAVGIFLVSKVHICAAMAFHFPNNQHSDGGFLEVRSRIPTPFSMATKSPTWASSYTSLRASSPGSSWSVRTHLDRKDAQSLLEGPAFLPSGEYGDRIVFGRQAAEQEYADQDYNPEDVGVMLSDDPRLARTYAEFPLSSLDALLDKAVGHLPTDMATSVNMVDIGSGLGRIVLYSALTRGNNEESSNSNSNWKVRGIEISPSLHNKALELVQTGIDTEIFEENPVAEASSGKGNSFSFHCGSAIDTVGQKLLEDAHLVFCYSTAFKATGFDPEAGALILDTEEWSLPLREACPDGCVVVTTDRALNPHLGWRIVDRLEVPNPEVLGTTGYIHVLEKEGTTQ